MTTAVFLDTNVIAYASDRTEERRRPLAVAMLKRLPSNVTFVSSQVLSEFANVVTHPRKLARPTREAVAGIRMITTDWTVLQVTPEVVIAALEASERWALEYYDAQIWATAALNGVPVVLSEDFSDGLQLGPVRFVDPFVEGFEVSDLDG
jgi:predicted nucleic acid-binding protein